MATIDDVYDLLLAAVGTGGAKITQITVNTQDCVDALYTDDSFVSVPKLILEQIGGEGSSAFSELIASVNDILTELAKLGNPSDSFETGQFTIFGRLGQIQTRLWDGTYPWVTEIGDKDDSWTLGEKTVFGLLNDVFGNPA